MMALVDTSVWIRHLRGAVPELVDLLGERRVLAHSVIIGELACGQFKKRHEFLGNLKILPRAPEVSFDEALDFIEAYRLHGMGLGFSDVQILASALLAEARLITDDKALQSAAERLGIE